MIKRVTEVINTVEGIEDIGLITNMYDHNADETNDPTAAVQCVVKYRDGYMNVDAQSINIHTVH